MPILTYKICNNRFASLISSSLLAFNPEVIYFTERIKQYTTDIFFTIFLILFGYIFFQKPVTKKRMLYFTIICIICSLFSYTAIIMTACLCFYYLFLFQKDNIKTKIVNFLIFIIPWLLILSSIIILIYYKTPREIFVSAWSEKFFYIYNFECLKSFIFYIFKGDKNFNFQLPFSFWYIFLPVIIGVILIIVKKNRYLFSMLILPVIIAEILGKMNIYPITNDRVSLWLCPIFIILFTIPTIYVKFNKKIFLCLLSSIIFVYYILIYNNISILTVKNLYNYSLRYKYNDLNSYLQIEELKKLDITNSDIICLCFDGISDFFEVLDSNRYFFKNKKINFNEVIENHLNLKSENYIYFYIYKDFPRWYENIYIKDWINKNMNIIYEYDIYNGDKIIKAKGKINFEI